ncbi:hypothetical protein [Acidisoma sp. 7E03]
MPTYRIDRWYWSVAAVNPATQVYSSASASFVGLTDAAYQQFLSDGGTPTKIDTEADLVWVFSNANYPQGAAGLTASAASVAS